MAATESRGGSLYPSLRWHLESVRALPSPRWPWRWHDVVGTGDGEVHPALAERLKDRDDGGIEPVPGRDGYWRTTERLAEYIEDRFDATLEPVGQSRLPTGTDPAPVRDSGPDCGESGSDEHCSEDGTRQLGLAGEDRTEAYEQALADRRAELYRERAEGGWDGVPKWTRADTDTGQAALDRFESVGTAPGRLAAPDGEINGPPSLA